MHWGVAALSLLGHLLEYRLFSKSQPRADTKAHEGTHHDQRKTNQPTNHGHAPT